MNRQLPQFAEERYAICKTCDNYKNDYCKVLQAKGKSGYLFHEKGLTNKRSACPNRLFKSFPSLHAILINTFIRPLDFEELHYWTNHNVNMVSLFDAVYRLHQPMNFDLTRSTIKQRLELISKYKNDYQDSSLAFKEMYAATEGISLTP